MNFVLVTGASTGIGFEITRYFIQKGIHVLANVRQESDAQNLKNKFGVLVTPLTFDVTDIVSIQSAFEKAKNVIGEHAFVSIVNNAGIVVTGPLLHIPIAEVEHQLNVNVLGLLRVTQTFFPLLKRKEKGLKHKKRIINIGSISGLFASPFVGPYCASKYAVEAITDSLRRELMIYDHIDAVVIEPGAVKTPIWEKARSESDDIYMKTDYGTIIKAKNKMIENSEKRAISPLLVAKLAYKMLIAKQPPTRKVIMKNKWVFNLIRKLLPPRIVDRQIRKHLVEGTHFRP